MVLEFGFDSETTEFDHGEREIDTVVFGFVDDGFVELEGWLVLGRVGEDEPAVVADWNEDANIHCEVQLNGIL